MLRHGFFFLNEVHKKILMENIDTMEQILQKNKKTFPVWNIIKKIKMVYNFRNVDEKQHSLIQIDNEKKLY